MGKTHFLRQLYSQLRYKDQAPVVYINAWESGFSKDPLLVIVSEITSQLIDQHEGYKAHKAEKEVGEKVKKIWNSMLKLGGCAAALSGLGPIYAPAKDLLSAEIKDEDELSLQELYPLQRKAVQDLKQLLSEYSEVINRKQIVIIVDELDRCRPNYAIELLETIKHFFEMPGYMFVVATDTEQLGHSIKAVYGSEFDGREYLSRFFNRSAKLPEPDSVLVKSN
ncbi:KAP family P-loop NTPase fold protein, partial [Pseudoalteromonas rubra]|uniref:KAP family P-loop NTPase fold protein n=1 Tax=Pseudoalteromonas rubra TaxID=43658 RepID=UPI002016A418